MQRLVLARVLETDIIIIVLITVSVSISTIGLVKSFRKSKVEGINEIIIKMSTYP